MEKEIFDSELGDVWILPDRIKRDKRKGDWSKIKSEFGSNQLLDSADFSSIEDLNLNPGSYYTVLKVKINGSWKQMFFKDSDDVEECFKSLKYKLNVYRQNH